MNDRQLLRDYVENGSESAFATLVQRHVNMVHAAALRQLNDSHLAQDVTQAVFILLARKAPSLRSSVVLAGWLYRATTHVASHALRDRLRRHRREQEVATMNLNEPTEELWEELAPHLDGAIASLSASDRDVVVLRFLQQQSFRAVADALSISEDAAKKRATRALDKLHHVLVRRGARITGIALGTLLLNRVADAAPAQVAVAASNAAGSATCPAMTLAAAVARDWFAAKIRWTAAAGVASLALLFVATFQLAPPSPTHVGAHSSSATAPTPSEPQLPQKSSATPDAGVPANPRTMRLKVVSAVDDSPIAGAVIEVNHYGQPNIADKAITDKNGIAQITRPDRAYAGMAYWIAASAYIPKCVRWNRYEGPSLPADYVVILNPGTRAQGIVVDEDGQPLAGAQLRFHGEGMKWNQRDYIDYRRPPTIPTSNEDGTWIADFVAPDSSIFGSVTHADYAETEFKFSTGHSGIGDVRIVIKRGAPISGSVAASDGTAVTNAQVVADWEFSNRQDLKTNTDANGRFTLLHVPIGRVRMKASAPGYRSFQKWFESSPTGFDLILPLEASRIAGSATLRGRVVDTAGQPLAGIGVALRDDRPGLQGVEWSSTTDQDGRFEWLEAPEGGARLYFYAWDYEHLQDVELASDGTERVITMKQLKSSTIRCVVLDRNSGASVPAFRVMTGKRMTLPDGKEVDHVEFAGEGTNGQFLFTWRPRPGESDEPILRVEADNYSSETVSLSTVAGGDAIVSVRLDAANEIRGVVFSPAGVALNGAEVALAGTRLDALMEAPARLFTPAGDSRYLSTKTAEDGSFRLPSRKEAELLIVVHDEGWALMDLRQWTGGSIQLAPWAKIQGTLNVGQTPGANLNVMARTGYRQADTIAFNYTARTDAAGHFAFDKIPPGHLEVGRWMLTPFSRNDSGFTTMTQVKHIEIASGQTMAVTLGGNGVRVKGRFVMDPPRLDVVFELPAQNLRPAHIQPDRSKPPSGYGFFCQPDGSFVADDITPGHYVLEAHLSALKDRNDPEASLNGYAVGERNVDIEVPEGARGELDLGEIRIPVRQDALPLGIR